MTLRARGRTASEPYTEPGGPTRARRCTRCAEWKALSEFAPKYRLLRRPHSYCRDCQSAYHREWYARNSERVRERVALNRRLAEKADRLSGFLTSRRLRWEYLLQHPCVDCGESDPVVLEFDHLREKRAKIAGLMRVHAPWSEIQAEIQKCQVRCANCHRRRTARVLRYYRELTERRGQIADRGDTA